MTTSKRGESAGNRFFYLFCFFLFVFSHVTGDTFYRIRLISSLGCLMILNSYFALLCPIRLRLETQISIYLRQSLLNYLFEEFLCVLEASPFQSLRSDSHRTFTVRYIRCTSILVCCVRYWSVVNYYYN